MPYRFEKLSILIVEDTLPLRRLMVSVLGTLGVGTIHASETAEHAYRLFQQNNHDIVITDWELPDTSGIDLVQKIRSDRNSPNRTVPVIVMTGYTALPRVSAARDGGATEFLVKPFSAADLARRIAHIINNPRDFVVTKDFFGPDRRRRKSDAHTGPERRRPRI